VDVVYQIGLSGWVGHSHVNAISQDLQETSVSNFDGEDRVVEGWRTSVFLNLFFDIFKKNSDF